MKKLVASLWQSFVDSYDPDEMTNASHPLAVLVAPGGFALVFAIAGFIPVVRHLSQFESPIVSVALMAIGSVFSLAAWRWRARGPIGAPATLIDSACYSSAVCWAAIHSRGGFAVGFAIVEAFSAVMVIAQQYALSVLLILALWLPALIIALLGQPEPAVSIILACACCVTIITSYNTKTRRALLRDRQRLEAELKESVAQLRVAEERDRIARDLHDGVGSQLAGLIWRVRGLATGPTNTLSREELETLERRVRETIEELRDVVLALRPEPMSWEETTALVTQRCQEMCGTIRFELDLDGAPDPATLRAVFPDLIRIIFELVRNAVRHGAASNVQVRMHVAGELRVRVTDDGGGFETDEAFRTHGGLNNVRRRVHDLSGRMDVASNSDGTSIEIVLPALINAATG